MYPSQGDITLPHVTTAATRAAMNIAALWTAWAEQQCPAEYACNLCLVHTEGSCSAGLFPLFSSAWCIDDHATPINLGNGRFVPCDDLYMQDIAVIPVSCMLLQRTSCHIDV